MTGSDKVTAALRRRLELVVSIFISLGGTFITAQRIYCPSETRASLFS